LAERIEVINKSFQDRVSPAWKEADDAMTAAERALIAARPSTTENRTPELAQKARDATALVTARLDAYADQLDNINNLTSGVTSDASILRRYFEVQGFSSLFKKDPNAEAAGSKMPDLADIQQKLKSLRDVAEKSSGQIRTSARLVGEPGFDSTDPNVAKLNEENWSVNFVDEFLVNADGESEFVIVQESPTRFNVKQLRFDPKANAQLGMAFADLGFDIATTVLQQTTGVKLETSKTGTTSEVTGDARKRIADDCRASLRAMSGTLNAEIKKLEQSNTNVDPALIGRVRGLLQGHHSLLSACTTALGKTSQTTPVTK
jgi:hypothetical protein